MKLFSCARTAELEEMIRIGHLRSTWEPSLCQHIDECRYCADFLLVSESLRSARQESIQNVPIVSPGLLWWRAQLRRRNQALQKMSRPTSIIGKLALISTFVVAIVALVFERQQSADWLRWLFGLQDSAAAHHNAIAAQVSVWNLLLGAITIGAFVLMSAFALFLASDKN